MSPTGTLPRHGASRRDVFAGAAALGLLSSLNPALARAAVPRPGDTPMPFIRTRDGVDIFYKDWGPLDAQPIVFHHGWPLSADAWVAAYNKHKTRAAERVREVA